MGLLHVSSVSTLTGETHYTLLDSSGEARVTSFAGSADAQTFDFQVNIAHSYLASEHWLTEYFKGGDISYIPPSFGHYIENTGNTTLKYLEIFKSGPFLFKFQPHRIQSLS